MEIFFACIHARADPLVKAMFDLKVLLKPYPNVALISLHNPPPTLAVLKLNSLLKIPNLEALQSIAPPKLSAVLFKNVEPLIKQLIAEEL